APASRERYTPSSAPATSVSGDDGASATARTACPASPALCQERPPSLVRKIPPPAAGSRVQPAAYTTRASRGSTANDCTTRSARVPGRPTNSQLRPSSAEEKMCPSTVPRYRRAGCEGADTSEITSPPGGPMGRHTCASARADTASHTV